MAEPSLERLWRNSFSCMAVCLMGQKHPSAWGSWGSEIIFLDSNNWILSMHMATCLWSRLLNIQVTKTVEILNWFTALSWHWKFPQGEGKNSWTLSFNSLATFCISCPLDCSLKQIFPNHKKSLLLLPFPPQKKQTWQRFLCHNLEPVLDFSSLPSDFILSDVDSMLTSRN